MRRVVEFAENSNPGCVGREAVVSRIQATGNHDILFECATVNCINDFRAHALERVFIDDPVVTNQNASAVRYNSDNDGFVAGSVVKTNAHRR